MSTYATVREVKVDDAAVLVNRNLLDDATAVVRVDVLDDAGPSVHRDARIYLTVDQAEELAVAILEAASLVYPSTAGGTE